MNGQESATHSGHDAVEGTMLDVLAGASGPTGARDMQRALEEQGIMTSEATVSRRFRSLDANGLTLAASRKGRVLTDQGRRTVDSRRRQSQHGALLAEIGTVRTGSDVVHLLEARRAIEPEAVRGGVGRMDEKSITRLYDAVNQHERTLLSDDATIPRPVVLHFHRFITSFTDNPLVAAMTDIALDPANDHVEAMLDTILQARHASRQSVEEHKNICNAVTAGDGEAAEKNMYIHIDRLIDDTKKFVDTHPPMLVTQLLAANPRSTTPEIDTQDGNDSTSHR